MRPIFRNLLIATTFLLVYEGMILAKTPARPLHSGRVISAVLSGQGQKTKETTRKTTDIWWTYCISADTVSYSVTSRKSPTATGLVNDTVVQFSEIKNKLSVISPRSGTIDFTILRKGAPGKCP